MFLMDSHRNNPIGIFDSGVGGLTVVRSIRRQLPGENIIYFGDTARVPYGNKSKSTIIRFSREIVSFLLKKKVKIVIVACNTASSLSLEVLKKEYTVPVIGVIEPGVKEAAGVSVNKKIGVIGTDSTISSGAYKKGLQGIDKGIKVFSRSCPLFVPLVENRHLLDKFTVDIAGEYLKGFKKRKIDTLILGCTHYPLLKNVINKIMGKVRLIDSSKAVAKEADRMLEQKNMRSDRNISKSKIKCFVSDDPNGFSASANIFLNENIKVSKVLI